MCIHVGFEVLTAVVMKSSVFWDKMPCSPLKINRHFGGTCLHLQGQRISQEGNQQSFLPVSCWFSCLAVFDENPNHANFFIGWLIQPS
jgi:hypothetical protein